MTNITVKVQENNKKPPANAFMYTSNVKLEWDGKGDKIMMACTHSTVI